MSAKLMLLRLVAECFKSEAREPRSEGMHCLGAGTGGQVSPSGFGSRGPVLSVVRALGVLVCEGRIQGPPRGYKEGLHCVPPLQSAPNNHVCEKDNYSCERYLVLVREITERVAIGSYLCVEVVLCSDCPCGLVKAKSKHRVLSVPPITSWQHSSEMLLEYWCIGIVPSKSPETMNSQGLYQAVRSRLHFSQVAAWWSRTAGQRPNHIATRIVQPGPGDEHLRRFREPPVEHTFPLAGLGDGNSVKVTVWALPRMEDIPRLSCPLHPEDAKLVVVEANVSTATCPHPVSKAAQPASNSLVVSASSSATTSPDSNGIVDGLLMPALLDDRLQIACDKPGKHHCSCADEEDDEVIVTSAAVARPNGERKRRRSLPCRPQPEPSASLGPEHAPPLPAVKESTTTSTTTATTNGSSCSSVGLAGVVNSTTSSDGSGESNNNGLDSLERSFRTQLSIEEQQECCGNLEKRYKRSESSSPKQQQQQQQQQDVASVPSSDNTHVPLAIPWISYSANGKAVSGGLPAKQQQQQQQRNSMNLVLNPFCTERAREKIAQAEQQARREQARLKSGGVLQSVNGKPSAATRLDDWKKDKENAKAEQGGLLDWISRVPGRVLGGGNNNGAEFVSVKPTTVQQATVTQQPKCEVKLRNCNLELSPREFDEVLAVLRARTPLGRRRTALRTAKRREKYDRLVNETTAPQPQQNSKAETVTSANGNLYSNVSNKADVLLGAILRSTSKEGNNRKNVADLPNGTKSALPTKEETESIVTTPTIKTTIKTPTVAATTTTNDCCPESSGVVMSPDCNGESSLPSALNKRLSRLRQLFKRDQDRIRLTTSESHGYSQPHQQCKRRIDFSAEQEDEDENEEEEDDDEEEEEDDEEEDEDEDGDETHCDSSVGTSTNSAHVNSIFHSTNSEKRNGCCTAEPSNELGAEQQRQRMECCTDVRTTPGKKKSRGKRDLSPIWVNHNNNHVSVSGKANGSSANENGTMPDEEGGETSVDKTVVPTAKDQERFRRSLEYAASMVFHSRTGLPLTSSPAPLRRGSCCFDFDSSLNSVSSKRSALFELNTPPSPGAVSLEEGDRETENACDIEEVTRRRSTSRNRPQSHALLGSFEESALNGRLEPVSTVHGFTAEIGASGSFCPKHRKLPVTVFFYTLGDNDKVSSPYLAHINLGKKGYQVPRMGTIQVTLSNPLGTVVKMFVVLYDLSDMPARSHTFLRQRTLRDKTLRYLIHLRFMSGKSGRIYLHTDVRMIICRKSDVDTASDFGSEPPKELRSYIHGPTNPKFSPRC